MPAMLFSQYTSLYSLKRHKTFHLSHNNPLHHTHNKHSRNLQLVTHMHELCSQLAQALKSRIIEQESIIQLTHIEKHPTHLKSFQMKPIRNEYILSHTINTPYRNQFSSPGTLAESPPYKIFIEERLNPADFIKTNLATVPMKLIQKSYI